MLWFRAGCVCFGVVGWDAVQQPHPGRDHPKEPRRVPLKPALKISLIGTRGIS